MAKWRRTIFRGLGSILLLISVGIIYYLISYPTVNDAGLALLTRIKSVRGQAVDLKNLEKPSGNTPDHQIWDLLLQKHVDSLGNVDYQGFIQDSTTLNQYLKLLSNHGPAKNWRKAAKLAYWINAYNAFTIRLIIDHFPVNSIKDIGGNLPMINSPWDLKFFTINGHLMDLNTIEHQIIRPQFQEPRIHFAVNCASVSCPKLRREAYVEEKLDRQLEDQTNYFLQNKTKNYVQGDTLFLSSIFSWFSGDFTKQQTITEFVNPYLPQALAKEPVILYLPYNWNLNDHQ